MKDWRWHLPLGLLLSLSSNLGRNFPFAFATVASIAVAVAMATGLEMTSRAIIVEFDRTGDALAGDAEIEIVAGSVGLKEDLLAEAAATPGVAAASPLVQATFRLASDGTAIRVLGMDFAEEKLVRDYTLERDGVKIRDPLRLIARPESIVVGQSLVDRLGLSLGDRLPVKFRGRDVELRIEGVLREQGLGRAFGGQVAAMDVYSLQTMVQREGWLDRIDVTIQPEAEVDTVVQALERSLAGRATARRSTLRQSTVGSMAEAVRLVTLIISSVGGTVACLLSYAANSLAVSRRSNEFLLLRSAGMEVQRLRTIIWSDCIAYAVIGLVSGISLGLALSRSVAILVSAVPSLLGGTSIESTDLVASSRTLLLGGCVGIGAALAGTRVASSRSLPLHAFDRSHLEPARLSPTALVVAISAWCLVLIAPGIPGVVRATLLFGTAIACVFLSAAFAGGVHRVAQPVLAILVPRVGHLLGTGLVARPRAVAMTVACMVAVATSVSLISTLASSFEESLASHSELSFGAGVRITAGTPFEVIEMEAISPESLARMQESKLIAAMSPSVVDVILYRGVEVDILAHSMTALAGRSTLAEECRDLSAGKQVGISTAFAARFGIGVGEKVELQTPKGTQKFDVVCEFRIYSGPAGVILMDLRAFEKLWMAGESDRVIAWPTGNADELVADLMRLTADLQPLFFVTPDSVREHVRRLVARFRSAFHLVATLGFVLGGAALATCALGISIDRQMEMKLLRTAGASSNHLVLVTMLDGVVIGSLGVLVGVPLALVIFGPLSESIAAAFGWTLVREVEITDIVASAAILIGTSIAASAYPALRAVRSLGR